MNGPSQNLSWAELACNDEFKTPYPEEWRSTRAVELAKAFERIRKLMGEPLIVSSGYRTAVYNDRIGGASQSQHVQGRALDLKPTSNDRGALKRLHAAALKARGERLLVGIGVYANFIHIDTRPGYRARNWTGSRVQ